MVRTLAPILEIKTTLSGREKRFECRYLGGDARHAVVLWVAPEPMHVHGVDLPAGTVSFGHFWADRPYNVYHWMDPRGRTIGFYFNLADRTVIGPERIEWQDLVVDVIAMPAGRVDVLDEDELPPDLSPETRARIDAGKAAILDDTPAVTAEIEAATQSLRPLVFPV